MSDLISEELWSSLPANGWLQREEAELLMEVACDTDGPILEVGVYYGKSTCLLATLRRLIYSVDPFYNFDSDDPSGDVVCAGFLKNLSERSIHNVQLSRCQIEAWAPKPCGFAYLDGDHTREGTLEQIQVARDCGVQELCLHDYDTNGGGLEIYRAIRDYPLNLIRTAKTMAHCRFVA